MVDQIKISKKNVHAVVGVIFDTNNRILAAKRQIHQSYAGYWEFPGGEIEAEEVDDFGAAIKRELLEELGINVINFDYLGYIEHEYTDHVVKLEVFKINNYAGNIHGKEGQEVRWIEASKISNLDPLLEASHKILDLIK